MAEKIFDVNKVNAQLAELSRQILPENMTLMYVNIEDTREQDINAQSMPPSMFDQLVQNIKDAGAPETVALLAKTERGLEIVSGHHRVRAARAAGLERMLVMVYENLSRSRIAAKQLAHNSIHGVSDPQLVQRIWDEITDVQARFEAYIDPKSFADVKTVSFKPVDVDMNSVSKSLLFVFLPTQAFDVQLALEQVMPKAEPDGVVMATLPEYDAFIEAIRKIREDMSIVNVAAAVAEMARLALERVAQLVEEREASAEHPPEAEQPVKPARKAKAGDGG